MRRQTLFMCVVKGQQCLIKASGTERDCFLGAGKDFEEEEECADRH